MKYKSIKSKCDDLFRYVQISSFNAAEVYMCADITQTNDSVDLSSIDTPGSTIVKDRLTQSPRCSVLSQNPDPQMSLC